MTRRAPPPHEVPAAAEQLDVPRNTQKNGLSRYIRAATAVVGVAASAVAVWAFFFHTPLEARTEPAEYEGGIDGYVEQQDFVDFISEHAGEIVRLHVWMPAEALSEQQVGASREVSYFMLLFDCPSTADTPSIDAGCTGMEYGVVIDPAGDATFGYNQGLNYLIGHFTVRPNPGMHQGILSTSLIGVRTEDVG